MRKIALFALHSLAVLSLTACVTANGGASGDDGPPLPMGSVVALGQPVAVDDAVLTPLRVTEDSRCAINARCVWAGRIIVETRVDGPGWRETVPMTLGEPEGVRGYVFNLISAEPGQTAGQETDPAAYRFAYEGFAPGNPPD